MACEGKLSGIGSFHAVELPDRIITTSWQCNNHVSAKRRAQVLNKIDSKYSSLSSESWESNDRELFGQLSSNNASSSRLKRVKQFPLTVLSKEENRFFSERLPLNPGIEEVQPVTGVLSSEVRPIDLQGHSGEEAEQQQPSPSQPLKTSEESPSRYRYVPRTFFKTHRFKTTYKEQNSSFLSKLTGHYQRPLGSEICSGEQDRTTFPPCMHQRRRET